MYQVIKRDGSVVEFDINKITSAISKAFLACNIDTHPSIIDMLALNVTSDFKNKISNNKVQVEDIQDSVEDILSRAGYIEVAKSYILYRKQRENVRNMKTTMLNYKEIIDSYVNFVESRDNKKYTIPYSVGGLILSNSSTITANYWLSEIYDQEISKAHRDGDIHIHDLSMLTGYSAGWSIKQLLLEGLGGVQGKIASKPAKHLQALCNQMVNFLGIMQNEWSGPQSFSSFDTYLAPFVKMDNLEYDLIKDCIESFVYGVNSPSRWGSQAPYSNITLDWTLRDDLKDEYCIVGGKKQNFKYCDCKKEMDMINRAFLEVMLEGDANGKCFEYPIPTYSITKDFDWSNNENNRLLFDFSIKYGTAYFANYINSNLKNNNDRNKSFDDNLDFSYLRNNIGGPFGDKENTGSIGVVTINLPRISYLSKTKEEFFNRLDFMMDLSIRSLNVKREVVKKLLDSGLYPYTKRYLGNYDNYYSTIGIVGMNEVTLNAEWLKCDLSDIKAQEFSKEVLNYMQERLVIYQQKHHYLYCLESISNEDVTYRLARHDKIMYKEIITDLNDNNIPYYSNGINISNNFKTDIFELIDIQSNLHRFINSGASLNIRLDDKVLNWEVIANLVRKISYNSKIAYYSISPTYSFCKNHGYLKGTVSICPICNEKVEVWSMLNGHYHKINK